MLHRSGVIVIVGAATSYDKVLGEKKRKKAYRKIIKDGVDTIESDRPLAVTYVIKNIYPKENNKYKYLENKNKTTNNL